MKAQGAFRISPSSWLIVFLGACRHAAEVEARLEKTRAMNARVSEAQQRKEQCSSPTSPSSSTRSLAEKMAAAESRYIVPFAPTLERQKPSK